MEGAPLTIVLSKRIDELDYFLNGLFSSKKPFRLWGLRKPLEPDYVKVCAIDLHNGDKIDFEITPEWLRIYLPAKACGNTVLRLITNIQRYYDSDAYLEGEHGRIV